VDGAAPGLREEGGARSRRAAERAKDPKKPDDLALFVEDARRDRTRAAVLPETIAALSARPRVPEAHELGRVARRRQGRFPVRPAHPLAAGAARRRRGAVHDLRARRRRARARDRAERHQTSGIASCRAERGAASACATPRTSEDAARASSWCSIPRARAASIAEQLAKANGGAPVANDHGLAAEWRDLVE
jgi:hypothetical protein